MISTQEALEAVPEEKREVIGTAAPELWDEVRPNNPYYDFEGNPIPMRTWAMLMESTKRQVRATTLGPYFVSTIWLGLDHSFGWSDAPLIYETMVFEAATTYSEERETPWGKLGGFFYHKDFDQRRYATQQEALDDHDRIVEQIRVLLAANPEWRVEGDGYAPVDTE